jgi:predicted ATPase
MLMLLRGRTILNQHHLTRCFSSAGTDGPLQVYKSRVASGEYREDPPQLAALIHLDKLHHKLKDYAPPLLPPLVIRTAKTDITTATAKFAKELGSDKTGFDGDSATFFGFELPSIFGGSSSSSSSSSRTKSDSTETSIDVPGAPDGLYMYGGVGCGKTMIMDMFYDEAPASVNKRRVHFHEFMIDCHARMHRLKQDGVQEDPIPFIARQMVEEGGHLLCFDEMQVTDIADALIMRRLFDEMFRAGVIVVATSNRPPNDLYYNGIQRHLFLPFIKAVEHKCIVHDLASPTDYRLLKTNEYDADGDSSTYHYPLNEKTLQKVDGLWNELTKGGDAHSTSLIVLGRQVNVPSAAKSTQVAKFGFKDLCAIPLGAGDYIAIARAYHTIFISDIPILSVNQLDQVRRLITCIDTFYEHNVKVIISAETPITEIFQPYGEVTGDHQGREQKEEQHGDLLGTKEYVQTTKDEFFAFDRTVSRLIEMQSVEYNLKAKVDMVDGDDIDTMTQFLEGPIDDDSIEKLWMRYDLDANGKLDESEMSKLIGDLSLVRRGHKNVPENEMNDAMMKMSNGKKGTGGKMVVEFEQFLKFVKETSVKKILTRSLSSGV